MGITEMIGRLAYGLRQGIWMEQYKEPALSVPIDFLSGDLDEQTIGPPRNREEAEALTADELIRIAWEARIVDARDGIPLFRKLKSCRDREVGLRLDAIDDEPYLCSQTGLLLKLTGQCIGGLKLVQKAIDSPSMEVEAYQPTGMSKMKIPKELEGVPVKFVGGSYPSNVHTEYSLVEEHDGKRYLYVGTAAMVHFYRAVYEGTKQSTVFLTVSGSCVAAPRNMEVEVGTPVTDVLDRCGLLGIPARIVLGGSITGQAVADTDKEVVSYTTEGVLAMRQSSVERHFQCIRCGKCTDVCPARLNPMKIYYALRSHDEEKLALLDTDLCTQCMSCSYICPVRLNIAAMIAANRRKKEEL